MIYNITDATREDVIYAMSDRLNEAEDPITYLPPSLAEYFKPNNSDWAKENPMVKRYKIAIEAVFAGATVVDVGNHHGVLVNNWILVAVKTNKWTYTMKEWYPYSSLETLFKKHVTDKLVK